MAEKVGATSLGMQSENFGYSNVRLRRIKKLQFGVVNPNELVRRSGSSSIASSVSGSCGCLVVVVVVVERAEQSSTRAGLERLDTRRLLLLGS
jgi:hypothetical protein